jgi:hypothetical protein
MSLKTENSRRELRSRRSKIAIIVKINSNWKRYYIILKLWELEFNENLNTISNV